MGQIGHPKTSVRNYRDLPRNYPEEQCSQQTSKSEQFKLHIHARINSFTHSASIQAYIVLLRFKCSSSLLNAEVH
jgi:hypothetical protein